MMRLRWDCVEGRRERMSAREGILLPCRISLSARFLSNGETGESGADR